MGQVPFLLDEMGLDEMVISFIIMHACIHGNSMGADFMQYQYYGPYLSARQRTQVYLGIKTLRWL